MLSHRRRDSTSTQYCAVIPVYRHVSDSDVQLRCSGIPSADDGGIFVQDLR